MVGADEPADVETRADVQVILTTAPDEAERADEADEKSSDKRTAGDDTEVTKTEQSSERDERGDGKSGEAISRSRWLGVQMGQVPDMLRKHLRLSENEGVLVMSVMPKSPSEQAGLETHDVIVRVGDDRVEGPESLSSLVQASEGEIVLTLIRAGDRQSVRLTPAAWPDYLLRDVLKSGDVLKSVTDGGEVNLHKMFIQGLGPIIARHPGEGGTERRAELHIELRDDGSGRQIAIPLGQPQFDVLVTPAPGQEPQPTLRGLRTDRIFLENPIAASPKVMPLPPGHDPERWDRLEKSLDRLNGVLERLEQKLGD